MMKHYDCIAIGTGSAMSVVEGLLNAKQGAMVAVVDKDDPGGICLTRACIPSKLLVYPAEVLRQVEEAEKHGIEVDIRGVDFQAIMERMRSIVSTESEEIGKSLQESESVDYYRETARFTGPYTMKVGDQEITADMIVLSPGSKPRVPDIQGLDSVSFLTTDTLLGLEKLPGSLVILGGGYVAAEYGHFFSAMGSEVTILGRNPQFLPMEEPEVSAVAKQKMSEKMSVITGHEVVEVQKEGEGKVRVRARDRETGQDREVVAESLLVAAGRAPNTDLLDPDRAGLQTDSRGWLKVNEHLETSVKNVWAFGDAIGKHLFKHAANHEARVVYANAVLKEPMTLDDHAIPHAVFTWPEIASVGMKEAEAVSVHGEDGVVVGFNTFAETARGEAMQVEDCFVKVILEESTNRLLGAHIIGPQASILIQELITVMVTKDQSPDLLLKSIHIHPSLSEVVEGAFFNLMMHRDYQHLLSHMAPELFG
jgi:dihydrolipoamide dehydrogenase